VRAMEVCVAENINSGTISILPCFPPQSSEPVVRVTEEKFTHFLFYPLVALGDTVTLTKALAAIVAEFPLRHPPSSPPRDSFSTSHFALLYKTSRHSHRPAPFPSALPATTQAPFTSLAPVFAKGVFVRLRWLPRVLVTRPRLRALCPAAAHPTFFSFKGEMYKPSGDNFKARPRANSLQVGIMSQVPVPGKRFLC
jgi:hypothetical protein